MECYEAKYRKVEAIRLIDSDESIREVINNIQLNRLVTVHSWGFLVHDIDLSKVTRIPYGSYVIFEPVVAVLEPRAFRSLFKEK